MRFFPRGAFTATPTIQDPGLVGQLQQAQQLQQQVQQLQLQQQVQQLQQQQQQLQQFQQQLWQQVGMPVAGPQASPVGPIFQPQAQVQPQTQAFFMQADLRADPLRMYAQIAELGWYQAGMGGFGRPIF